MRIAVVGISIAAAVAATDVASRATLGCDLLTLAERAGRWRPAPAAPAAPLPPPSAQRPGSDLVKVVCVDGALVTTTASPWYVNSDAPWKWKPAGASNGDKIAVDAMSADKRTAVFRRGGCGGSVRAYICDGDQCKGPIDVPVE